MPMQLLYIIMFQATEIFIGDIGIFQSFIIPSHGLLTALEKIMGRDGG
ncbi:hypothetical protein AAULR_25051 [Lacticaseibacillus rhamnosus MTCC 5462]|nr:hypothetical protein AAULR_25051 [Lacticaseibacillus rhamnosus MTCC 5462]